MALSYGHAIRTWTSLKLHSCNAAASICVPHGPSCSWRSPRRERHRRSPTGTVLTWVRRTVIWLRLGKQGDARGRDLDAL